MELKSLTEVEDMEVSPTFFSLQFGIGSSKGTPHGFCVFEAAHFQYMLFTLRHCYAPHQNVLHS